MAVEAPDPPLTFTGRALGSTLRLHVRPAAGGGGPAAPARPAGWAPVAQAWDRVRAEFDAVDLALSRFRDDSELTDLNRRAGDGGVAVVSWRLRTALAAIHRAGWLTDGRFDARVLGSLERMGERGAALDRPRWDPTPAPRAAPELPGGGPAAHPRASTPRERAGCRVRVPDTPLDLGGIGKGLALRWAASAGLEVLPPGSGLLLEAGGDLVGAGRGTPEAWLVGIEDPVAPATEGPVAVVELRDGAVATSSVRVRNWLGPDGRPVHHIVDPRTGEPARTGLIAVTVAGPDPAWAEVWSKALFIAGRARIAEEARARGLAAWWVDDRGRVGLTPDARLRSAWVAEQRLG